MNKFEEKTPKAIRDYVCYLCEGEIKKGDIYHYSSFVDNQIFSFRSHLHCNSLLNKLKIVDLVNMSDEGPTFDLFEEVVSENYDLLVSGDDMSLSDKSKKLFKVLGE